jgi:UDP-N-acetylglucosamine--N-acetylmuramyl-(pentapeptide) pyrophosphoryl-undecaprenol N-acetylglucosamine transferase
MRILFAGGGTGGHLIPAINIANALRAKLGDAEFLFVGIKGGMEKEIVEKNGYTIQEIEVVGLKRNLTGMVDFSKKIMRAFSQADKVVRAFGPEIVIGTGGYLSAPVVLAGKRRRARVLIQEQNIFPGLATRFLARFADKICLAFDGSKRYLQGVRNLVVTGNPLRNDLVLPKGNGYLNEFGLKAGLKVLFVTGGSRGAQSLNEGILQFIKDGNLPDNWQILWQTGQDKHDNVAKELEHLQFSGVIQPFIHSMPEAYSVADLMVCRAGAMTLSELLVLGMPALLVPFPHATANHQMKNAMDLKNKGAVEVIADNEVKTERFSRLLSGLIRDEARRKLLSENAAKLGNKKGAEAITEEILKLL